MKRALLSSAIVAGLVIAQIAPALANPTATGILTVSATVASSIDLVFVSDSSGPTLTGTGTNAATLALGTVQAFGATSGGGVTVTPGGTGPSGTSFQVSAPFDVYVTKANDGGSSAYTLTCQLGTSDLVNTWTVGGVTVTSGSAATVSSSATYNANDPFTLQLTVPYTEAAGSISNTLNFTATAN